MMKKWNGKRIATFRDVDATYEFSAGTAKSIFMLHREELIEEKDFTYVTRKAYHDECAPEELLRGNP